MNQHPTRRHALVASAATLAGFGIGLATAPVAWAQSGWPSKPIKLVVNFPPGGAADTLARLVSPALAEGLGQPVVVENRGGSGGNLGADAVAKSAADGYTLLMASGGTMSINPHIYTRMPFDPARDLVPVSGVARVSVYLVCRPDLPAANVQEFIALLRARPGKLSYGSPGNGSSPHLAAEMMKAQTGTFAVHVPYRGAAPALNDLLGGQIDFAFDPGIGLQHVRTGRLRLLAVGSPQRSPLFPQTPTLAESGLPGFDADSFFGIYAPAGTPADIVDRLSKEVARALASTTVRERIVAIGGEAAPLSPAEFNRRMHDDSQRFGKIIRERKIVGD